MPIKRQYPHVPQIADYPTQQTIRLLWDRVFDLEGRLQENEATTQQLSDTTQQHNSQLTELSQRTDAALANAQPTNAEARAIGGLSPGEPATGPGSRYEPIIPMSIDPVAMEADIKASLYHWSRADYSYWLSVVQNPWQGGDAKWYQGWDAYMEERARPGNAGFASHDLLPLPAVYTTAPPVGYPSGGWT